MNHLFPTHLVFGIGFGLLATSFSWGTGYKSPDECLAYTGDAHLNCLYAYIEIQKDTISKLERRVRNQEETTQRIQNQFHQQEAITRKLNEQIREGKEKRSENQLHIRRPFFRYSYGFGEPYYYDPYFGPPFGNSYAGYYPWW